MRARERKLGLTLASLMVAVGLSGVLAVAGVRLVGNQMSALRVMELADKGDAIFKFYSNLLHDDKVWWCTLYDAGGPTVTSANLPLRRCIFGKGSSCPSGSRNMRLMGPDCEFGGNALTRAGALNFSNFDASNIVLIKSGGMHLKDSATREDTDGWWKVEVEWEHRGNNAVDLVFTQSFVASRWRGAGNERHLPQLNYPRELRLRRSTNYVPGNGCGDKAVTAIALHSSNRDVSCGSADLVDTTRNGLGNCPRKNALKGGVVESTTACSSDSGRVAVTPTSCVSDRSVIWKIGAGVSNENANVECALGGSGKLVHYSNCALNQPIYACTPTTPGPWPPSVPRPTTRAPAAVRGIDSRGRVLCGTRAGFPYFGDEEYKNVPGSMGTLTDFTVSGQGPRGRKGRPTCGERGARGESFSGRPLATPPIPAYPDEGCGNGGYFGNEDTHWQWFEDDNRSCPLR